MNGSPPVRYSSRTPASTAAPTSRSNSSTAMTRGSAVGEESTQQ